MGFFSLLGRGFKHMFGIFGDLFKSEAMKFVARYKEVFVRVVLDIAASELMGDRTRQQEAFARAKAEFKRMGVAARDSFINLAIEMVLSELKAQKRIP